MATEKSDPLSVRTANDGPDHARKKPRLARGLFAVLLLPVWLPPLSLLVVTYLFAVVLLLVLVGAHWLFVSCPLKLVADRRYRAHLAALGRLMNADDLEAAIGSGGTLLLERKLGCDGAARVWWTSDRIEPDAASADTNDDWLARQAALWSACRPYVQEGARGATLIKPEPLLDQRVRRAAEGLGNVKVIEFYSGEGMDTEIRWRDQYRHDGGTLE